MKKFVKSLLALTILGITAGTAYTGVSLFNKNELIEAHAISGVLSGEGTEDSPFLIEDVDDFVTMATNVNQGIDNGEVYSLTTDLDLSGALWTPIGTKAHSFEGIFWGNGHKISGTITIDESIIDEESDYSYHGVFGYVNYGAIYDVILEDNFYYTSSSSLTETYICGSLIGKAADSTIVAVYDQSTMVNTIGEVLGGEIYRGGLHLGGGADTVVNTIRIGANEGATEGYAIGFKANTNTNTDKRDDGCFLINGTEYTTRYLQIDSSKNVVTLLESPEYFGQSVNEISSSAKSDGFELVEGYQWKGSVHSSTEIDDSAVISNASNENYSLLANWKAVSYTFNRNDMIGESGSATANGTLTAKMYSSMTDLITQLFKGSYDLTRVSINIKGGTTEKLKAERTVSYDSSGNRSFSAWQYSNGTGEINLGNKSATYDLYAVYQPQAINASISYSGNGGKTGIASEVIKDNTGVSTIIYGDNKFCLTSETQFTYELTLKFGYELSGDVTISGDGYSPAVALAKSETTVDGVTTYTFTCPEGIKASNNQINVVINKVQQTVDITKNNSSCKLNDSINVDDSFTTYVGDNFTLMFTANTGFGIKRATISGITCESNSIAYYKDGVGISTPSAEDKIGADSVIVTVTNPSVFTNAKIEVTTVERTFNLTISQTGESYPSGVSYPNVTVSNSLGRSYASGELGIGNGTITVTTEEGNKYYDIVSILIGSTTLSKQSDNNYYFEVEANGSYTLTINYEKHPYTISYYPNYGYNPVFWSTQLYREENYILPSENPTREGYYFTGWKKSTSSDSIITSSTTFDGTSDETINAQWSKESYTINFETNGGSACSSITKLYNSPIALLTPTKEGYTFTGWSMTNASDAERVNWTTMPDLGDDGASITLYAQWEIESYTINYDSKGGSACSSTEGEYGSPITLPTPTKEGYLFKGWSRTDSEAGVLVDWTTIPDLGANNESVTLYAQWIIEKYTIKFNSNGEELTSLKITGEYGSPITLPTPTRGGYSFKGWSRTDSDAEIVNWTTIPDLGANNESVTLYAQWEAQTYTITFKNNDGSGQSTDLEVIFDSDVENYTLPEPSVAGLTHIGWAVRVSDEEYDIYSSEALISDYIQLDDIIRINHKTLYKFDETVIRDLSGAGATVMYALWKLDTASVAYSIRSENLNAIAINGNTDVEGFITNKTSLTAVTGASITNLFNYKIKYYDNNEITLSLPTTGNWNTTYTLTITVDRISKEATYSYTYTPNSNIILPFKVTSIDPNAFSIGVSDFEFKIYDKVNGEISYSATANDQEEIKALAKYYYKQVYEVDMSESETDIIGKGFEALLLIANDYVNPTLKANIENLTGLSLSAITEEQDKKLALSTSLNFVFSNFDNLWITNIPGTSIGEIGTIIDDVFTPYSNLIPGQTYNIWFQIIGVEVGGDRTLGVSFGTEYVDYRIIDGTYYVRNTSNVLFTEKNTNELQKEAEVFNLELENAVLIADVNKITEGEDSFYRYTVNISEDTTKLVIILRTSNITEGSGEGTYTQESGNLFVEQMYLDEGGYGMLIDPNEIAVRIIGSLEVQTINDLQTNVLNLDGVISDGSCLINSGTFPIGNLTIDSISDMNNNWSEDFYIDDNQILRWRKNSSTDYNVIGLILGYNSNIVTIKMVSGYKIKYSVVVTDSYYDIDQVRVLEADRLTAENTDGGISIIRLAELILLNKDNLYTQKNRGLGPNELILNDDNTYNVLLSRSTVLHFQSAFRDGDNLDGIYYIDYEDEVSLNDIIKFYGYTSAEVDLEILTTYRKYNANFDSYEEYCVVRMTYSDGGDTPYYELRTELPKSRLNITGSLHSAKEGDSIDVLSTINFGELTGNYLVDINGYKTYVSADKINIIDRTALIQGTEFNIVSCDWVEGGGYYGIVSYSKADSSNGITYVHAENINVTESMYIPSGTEVEIIEEINNFKSVMYGKYYMIRYNSYETAVREGDLTNIRDESGVIKADLLVDISLATKGTLIEQVNWLEDEIITKATLKEDVDFQLARYINNKYTSSTDKITINEVEYTISTENLLILKDEESNYSYKSEGSTIYVDGKPYTISYVDSVLTLTAETTYTSVGDTITINDKIFTIKNYEAVILSAGEEKFISSEYSFMLISDPSDSSVELRFMVDYSGGTLTMEQFEDVEFSCVSLFSVDQDFTITPGFYISKLNCTESNKVDTALLENFIFKLSDSNTEKYKPITITASFEANEVPIIKGINEKEFNASEAGMTFQASDFVKAIEGFPYGDDNITYKWVAKDGNKLATATDSITLRNSDDAGNYTILITINGTGFTSTNYTFDVDFSCKLQEITYITVENIEGSISNEYTYDGKDKIDGLTAIFKNGDNLLTLGSDMFTITTEKKSGANWITVTEAKDIGEYRVVITLTSAGAKIYTLNPADLDTTFTFTINKKDLTIGIEKVFDATTTFTSENASIEGLVDGQTAVITGQFESKDANDSVNIASYTLSINKGEIEISNSNYNITITGKITKYTATISVETGKFAYSKIYNDSEIDFSLTPAKNLVFTNAEGRALPEEIEVYFASRNGVDGALANQNDMVGTYQVNGPLTVKIGGVATANYEFTFEDNNRWFEIQAVNESLRIEFDNASILERVYAGTTIAIQTEFKEAETKWYIKFNEIESGLTIYNLDNSLFTQTAEILEGITFRFVNNLSEKETIIPKDAGTYNLIVEGSNAILTKGLKFTATENYCTFKINKKEITLSDIDKDYDGTAELTKTFLGVGSDGVVTFIGTYTSKNAGAEVATIDALTNSNNDDVTNNYDIVNATGTINKKEITVNNVDKDYDGTNVLTGTFAGVGTDGTVSFTGTYASKDAGSEVATIDLLTNYIINATGTINKRSIAVDDVNKIYDGTNALSGTFTGVGSDGEVTFTGTYSSKNAGAGVATIDALTNYIVNATGTITKKDSTINLKNGEELLTSLTKKYNGTKDLPYGVSISFEKLEGDNVIVSAEYASQNKGENIAILYTINGEDKDNYNFIYSITTGRIVPYIFNLTLDNSYNFVGIGDNPVNGDASYEFDESSIASSFMMLINSKHGTRVGYTFNTWYAEKNIDLEGKVTYSNEITESNAIDFLLEKALLDQSNITLYSSWTVGNYVVTFNAKGGVIETGTEWIGSGDTATKELAYGSVYGSLPIVSRTGYTFNGWWTLESEGTEITSESSFNETTEQNIYAHWTANTYIVKFNKNSDEAIGLMEDKTFTYDETTIPANEFTREGYKFIGWNTLANGEGLNYYEGDKNLLTEGSIELFAQWQIESYNIRFELNGGTSEVNLNGAYEYGSDLPSDLTKIIDNSSYRFVGWCLENENGNGKGAIYRTCPDLGEDGMAITLYAQWTINDFALTITMDNQNIDSYTLAEIVNGNKNIVPPTTTGGNQYKLNSGKIYRLTVILKEGYEFEESAFTFDENKISVSWNTPTLDGNKYIAEATISEINDTTEVLVNTLARENTITFETVNAEVNKVEIYSTETPTTVYLDENRQIKVKTGEWIKVYYEANPGYSIASPVEIREIKNDMTINKSATANSYLVNLIAGEGIEKIEIESGCFENKVTTNIPLIVLVTPKTHYDVATITCTPSTSIGVSNNGITEKGQARFTITGFTDLFDLMFTAEKIKYTIGLKSVSIKEGALDGESENVASVANSTETKSLTGNGEISVLEIEGNSYTYKATAKVEKGYIFEGWYINLEIDSNGQILDYGTKIDEGLYILEDNTYSYTKLVEGNLTLTALFRYVEYSINVSVDDTYSWGTFTYGILEERKELSEQLPHAKKVLITPTPSKGYEFSQWSYLTSDDTWATIIESIPELGISYFVDGKLELTGKTNLTLRLAFKAKKSEFNFNTKLYINGIETSGNGIEFATAQVGTLDQYGNFKKNDDIEKFANGIVPFWTNVDVYLQFEINYGYEFGSLISEGDGKAVPVNNEFTVIKTTVGEGLEQKTYYVYKISGLNADDSYKTLVLKINAVAVSLTIDFIDNEDNKKVDAGRIFVNDSAFGVITSGNAGSSVTINAVVSSELTITAYSRFDFVIVSSGTYYKITKTADVFDDVRETITDRKKGFTSSYKFSVKNFVMGTEISIKVISEKYKIELYDGETKIGETISNVKIGSMINTVSCIDAIKELANSKVGYELLGFYTAENCGGNIYIDAEGNSRAWNENGYIWNGTDYIAASNFDPNTNTIKLYAGWSRLKSAISISSVPQGIKNLAPTVAAKLVITTINNTNSWLNINDIFFADMLYGADIGISAPVYENYIFNSWTIVLDDVKQDPIYESTYYKTGGFNCRKVEIFANYFVKVGLESGIGGTAKLTANDIVIESGKEGYIPSVNSFILEAIPDAGYRFVGWYDKATGNMISDSPRYVYPAGSDNEIIPMTIEAEFEGNIVSVSIGDYDKTNGHIEKIYVNGELNEDEIILAKIGDVIELYVYISTERKFGVKWNSNHISFDRKETVPKADQICYIYRYDVSYEDVVDNNIVIYPTISEETISIKLDVRLNSNADYEIAGEVVALGSQNGIVTLSYGEELKATIKAKDYYKISAILLDGRSIGEYLAGDTLTIPSALLNNLIGSEQHILTIRFTELLWIESNNLPMKLQGDGTERNPYLISTAEELTFIAYKINVEKDQSYANSRFKLIKDISLFGKFWTPIGTEDCKYNGSFNFNGFKVYGISLQPGYEQESTQYNGVFAELGDKAEIIINNNAITIIAISCSVAFGLIIIGLTTFFVIRRKRKKKMDELANG